MPTRGRPKKFIELIQLYIEMTVDRDNTSFLISCDKDDISMCNDSVIAELSNIADNYKNITVIFGMSENKIHAVNRDIDKYGKDWEVLLLTSDDMIPIVSGYDNIIREEMETNFPDTDGVLWFKDGYTPLNTLPIIGRKYYYRFGYVYYPGYSSFFADNQFHDISFILNKVKVFDEVIIRHDHPANTKVSWDETYEKNNHTWNEDEQLYLKMKEDNFLFKGGLV
jgi:hypothetical protein